MMLASFYHILFLVFTIYVLVYSISYGLYEIKQEKNTFGGGLMVAFTIFSVVFSNIMVWKN